MSPREVPWTESQYSRIFEGVEMALNNDASTADGSASQDLGHAFITETLLNIAAGAWLEGYIRADNGGEEEENPYTENEGRYSQLPSEEQYEPKKTRNAAATISRLKHELAEAKKELEEYAPSPEIKALLKASSLGSKEVREMAEQTPRDTARLIVMLADAMHHQEDAVSRSAKMDTTISRVRQYAEERARHGRRGRVVDSARIASDLFEILEANDTVLVPTEEVDAKEARETKTWAERKAEPPAPGVVWDYSAETKVANALSWCNAVLDNAENWAGHSAFELARSLKQTLTQSVAAPLETVVPRCQNISRTPWGPSQCALSKGHSEAHAYSPSESLEYDNEKEE